MKELSLHILDITQNSIRAGATLVTLTIHEDILANVLEIIVEDNGKGISKEMLPEITNPFVTTRTTRKIGLGLSLFKEAAETCGGHFEIQSEEGRGTRVFASFEHNHIDRVPLGDMPQTVVTMLLSFNGAELVYHHCYNGYTFTFDTREIRSVLGEEIALNDPDILNWIREYVQDGLKEIMEETS